MISWIKKCFHKFFVRHLDDESIQWLSLSVPGMPTRGNFFVWDYVFKNWGTGDTMLEIGSFSGLSAIILSHLKISNGVSAEMICVDPWIFEGQRDLSVGKKLISAQQFSDFVQANCLRNINFFIGDDGPRFVKARSIEFLESNLNGVASVDVKGVPVSSNLKFSFVFIDGDHSYDYVKKEFLLLDRSLEKGGYLHFDDSSIFNKRGSARLMKDISRLGNYKLVMRNPNYLWQKIG